MARPKKRLTQLERIPPETTTQIVWKERSLPVPAVMLVLTVICLVFIFVMKKRMTVKEIYVTWITVALFTFVSDFFFVYVFHFIGFWGQIGLDWRTAVVELLLPSAGGVIYCNFIPQTKGKLALDIAFWAVLSTLVEWVAIRVGYLQHIHWSLWLSGGFYLCIYLYLAWHIQFLRREKTDFHSSH